MIDIKWLQTDISKAKTPWVIIAISNTGLVKYKNGYIKDSNIDTRVTINGKYKRIYYHIADNFLQTVHRPDQIMIDHITHNPNGININDVRNLRWCTKLENERFEEARLNKSIGHKNKQHTNSVFGNKYFEHYGYSNATNPKQYHDELNWYLRHNNKCRWE